MSSLDTNTVLRFVLRDISDQTEKIAALVDRAKPGSLMVADAVFFECAWILAGKLYKFDRTLIGEFLLQIADIPQISCNRSLLERVVPLYTKTSNISFIDACLAIYAELNNSAPLLTFDKKLAKALPKSVTVL